MASTKETSDYSYQFNMESNERSNSLAKDLSNYSSKYSKKSIENSRNLFELDQTYIIKISKSYDKFDKQKKELIEIKKLKEENEKLLKKISDLEKKLDSLKISNIPFPSENTNIGLTSLNSIINEIKEKDEAKKKKSSKINELIKKNNNRKRENNQKKINIKEEELAKEKLLKYKKINLTQSFRKEYNIPEKITDKTLEKALIEAKSDKKRVISILFSKILNK